MQRFALPESALTKHFWDACKDGRLTYQRCDDCGAAFFRPEIACPHCLSSKWSWQDSKGAGTLYSFSVSYRAPTPAFTAPFIFAVVDMDEGYSMFSNLVGLKIEDAKIGMRLQVRFHAVSDEMTVPLFSLA
ncbi:MAG: Zn-ribbon domain-containing OB-fold protein [Rhizomicrobium sp.]